jgi:hypothetical protein
MIYDSANLSRKFHLSKNFRKFSCYILINKMALLALQKGWDKRLTEIFGISEDNSYICRLFVG